MQTNHFGFQTVPWVGQLIAGLSPPELVFDPRSVDVGFVVDNVALGQVSLQVLQFSPVSIVSPMFDTHLHLQVSLTRMTEQNE